MKHGCTTCFDHHYVFPAGQPGTCWEPSSPRRRSWASACSCLPGQHGPFQKGRRPAAGQRGSDGGRNPEGLRPGHRSLSRSPARLHAAGGAGPLLPLLRQPGSCCGRAPSWPGSTASGSTPICAKPRTRSTTRWSAIGVRPLEYMASLGWTGPDVWYAHGIHFND